MAMGRKTKNVVDYFPHFVSHGKTMFILENKYGNDGYAIWFKTLEILGANENHFFDCRNTEEWEFLLAKYKADERTVISILDTTAKLGAIHEELWENKVLWSWNFINGLESVYKRRDNLCMHFNDLCKHLSIKCKHKYTSSGIIDNRKPYARGIQSRVEDSRVKDSIVFVDFWNLYNRKVGNKKECEKKWNNLTDSERQKAIDTLPIWLKQFSDKQFQPYPETYLNQVRWDDELPEIDEPVFRDKLAELEEIHRKNQENGSN